jgi:uncharacterized membrane protein YhaH (DUF805 family)
MTFGTAVRSVLTQYVTFSGRARRSEYWWFVLFNSLIGLAATLIDDALNTGVFSLVVGLGLLLPGLAVGVRRLHDSGHSAWWLLIALVPLAGAIVLLVFLCTDSEPGPNRFGPSPKEAPAEHVWSQQPPAVPPTWH